MKNKRNSSIDFAKFIASLMVISIHTELMRDISANFGFWWNDVICRLRFRFLRFVPGITWAQRRKALKGLCLC